MLVRMDLTLPRDARYVSVMRNVAECVLDNLQAPPEAIDDVTLAITEACANVVRHAVGSAEYAVSLGVGTDGCRIEIIDVGPGFDPLGDELDLQLDGEAEAGRGLYLIRELVDRMDHWREDDQTHVLLTKNWEVLDEPVQSLGGERV